MKITTGFVLLACGLAATSACTDASDEVSAEEEAAAAAAGGKADDAGFKFGNFHTDNFDYAEKEPLVATFHKPNANLPAGESGYFDMARYSSELDSEYTSGTFKLYTYRGRDRIRFTDEGGHVVGRSDWKLDGGTYSFGGESALSRTSKLAEDLVSCLAMDVIDDGVFEEGLSVNEYPDVDIEKNGTKFSMQMGSSPIDADNGTVTVTDTASKIEARGKWTDQSVTMIIRVPKATPMRGEILQKDGSGPEKAIATIACE